MLLTISLPFKVKGKSYTLYAGRIPDGVTVKSILEMIATEFKCDVDKLNFLNYGRIVDKYLRMDRIVNDGTVFITGLSDRNIEDHMDTHGRYAMPFTASDFESLDTSEIRIRADDERILREKSSSAVSKPVETIKIKIFIISADEMYNVFYGVVPKDTTIVGIFDKVSKLLKIPRSVDLYASGITRHYALRLITYHTLNFIKSPYPYI